MLDENVDLVAGDFNGAAWRCDNRNNISTIEEAFADCALPMRPGSTPLWDPDRFRATGLLRSLNRVNPIGTGKYGFMVLSAFLMKACAPPIKAATTKHGSTSTLSCGMTYSSNLRNMIVVAVPLRQEERAYKGCYERPFTFAVMSRPFLLADARASFIPVVNHPHCMHDHPNTACQKREKNRNGQD